MDAFFGLDKVTSHDGEVAHLTTVHNPAELSLLRSILDGENVPYFIRERAGGAAVKAIMGYSMFGTDIFVPKELLEKAQELLEAYRNGEVVEDGEALCEDEDGI
ncbi:MAG: DUF2007 domain-containing protein [Clostridia bacterium]|nr:DUF2007 domain-containing protein [Clostridia bacterium]